MKSSLEHSVLLLAASISLALSGAALAAKSPPPPKAPPGKSPHQVVAPAVVAATLEAATGGDTTANLYVPFDWNINVANIGTVATTGEVTITDVLPAAIQISYLAAGSPIPGGPQFVCSVSGRTVLCSTTDPVPANSGAVPVVSLSVYATAGTSAKNEATVNWSSGAAKSPKWSTTLTDTIVRTTKVRPRAGGAASATMGVPFGWTMGLINIGNAPSAGTLTITDTIDPGVVISGITASSGAACSQSGQVVTCTTNNSIPPMIGDQDLPDSLMATINVVAPAGSAGAVSHQATASWNMEAPATMGSATSYPWWTALDTGTTAN